MLRNGTKIVTKMQRMTAACLHTIHAVLLLLPHFIALLQGEVVVTEEKTKHSSRNAIQNILNSEQKQGKFQLQNTVWLFRAHKGFVETHRLM